MLRLIWDGEGVGYITLKANFGYYEVPFLGPCYFVIAMLDCNFQLLDVVGCGRETQLQVGEKINSTTQRFNIWRDTLWMQMYRDTWWVKEQHLQAAEQNCVVMLF